MDRVPWIAFREKLAMVAPNTSNTPPEDDPMGPPKEPCEVCCIHCGNTYMSSEIRWQPDVDGPDGGWWVCPIDGCDGAGFCFDIYPTDPEVARSHGVMMFSDDDEDDEFEDDADWLGETPPQNPHDPHNPDRHRPRFTADDSTFGEDDIPF